MLQTILPFEYVEAYIKFENVTIFQRVHVESYDLIRTLYNINQLSK